MLPGQQWARNFKLEDDDVDYLINVLLEKETPLNSADLARILIERRLTEEASAIEEKYRNTRLYNPGESYAKKDRLLFPALDFATAEVTGVREGNNADYGPFKVLTVVFDDQPRVEREFAAEFEPDHELKVAAETGVVGLVGSDLTSDDIVEQGGEIIMEKVEDMLQHADALVRLARTWFPRDLLLEINEGHLNLAEAVLDMLEGGPLHTDEIIEQIGGISSSSPQSLQVFSLNYAMKDDKRFDEVGPTGEVLWYLRRMEPPEVQELPEILRYTPIEHDRKLLDEEALRLEEEIGDELSPLPEAEDPDEGTVTLLYPHRRLGVLPLNGRIRHIFPSSLRSRRIYITLVDGQDGEEFTGWVVPEFHFISGLLPIYNKHSLPIGAYVTVRRAETPERVIVDFNTHKARTEWVRLFTPHGEKGEQIVFENTKRGIGADYDDLMILGIDDLEAVDAAVVTLNKNRRTLASLLRLLVTSISKLNPQGTAHLKTIYSAVNVVRRCPPGPIIATLEANPDFVNMGGQYWRLAEE